MIDYKLALKNIQEKRNPNIDIETMIEARSFQYRQISQAIQTAPYCKLTCRATYNSGRSKGFEIDKVVILLQIGSVCSCKSGRR